MKKLLKNKLFWLLVSIIIMIPSIFLYRKTNIDFYNYVFLVALAYPVILTIIMLVYAWIINPIKSLKKRKEK